MKITYISHSGFAVELPSATLLFDYHKGTIPAFPVDKPLYVFASHCHGDHFVPQIFDLAQQYPQVTFILSHDIWMMRKKHTRAGVPEETFESATYLRAHETRTFSFTDASNASALSANVSAAAPVSSPTGSCLTVSTLRSTDMGVAFLVECDGQRIYHAGDLHWWAWPGDTKQAANNMAANYQREISYLRELLTLQENAPLTADTPPKNATLDLAFLPLDGRLEENYAMGMDYFLSQIPVKHVFPMHFWDHYEVIADYLHTVKAKIIHPTCTSNHSLPTIYSITQEGQMWSL